MDEFISENFTNAQENQSSLSGSMIDKENQEYIAPSFQNGTPSDTGLHASPNNKPNRGAHAFGIVTLIVCMVCAVALLGYAFIRYIGDNNQSTPDQPQTESESQSSHESQSSEPRESITPEFSKDLEGLSYIECVEKCAPCVVAITTEAISYSSFWQQYVVSGAGSGVIISADGYIITNHHVVDEATGFKVTLDDGTVYDARLIGTDPEIDIALLKIDASDLPYAKFGRSADLKRGQEILVIGNPLGTLGGSVSNGLISALNREIEIENMGTSNLIQTNAAINPGNSGGGVFDAAGNLIGIVRAKSVSEEVEGIGFFIPIDDVCSIIEDLSAYGYVHGRPSLDMTTLAITSTSEMWMYGVSHRGLYIYSVVKGGVADQAGLKAGDMIAKVNDTKINYESDFQEATKNIKVGDVLTLLIVRGNSEKEFSLTVGESIPQQIRNLITENTDNP